MESFRPGPLERSPESLTGTTFDLAVVGGGITGCCIARDAARRGLRVALVERRDFSSGTSSATSRLVHGGLRYLKSLELRVVRESLRERRIWGFLAPDAVIPRTFLLPTFGRGNDAWMRLALRTYDLLSFDRNRDVDQSHHIDASRHHSRAELAALEPILAGTTATGGLSYGDSVSDAPERLALACLVDAVSHGAVCVNYCEATALLPGRPHRLTVRDQLSGASLALHATVVVNATGPWSDAVAGALGATRVPRVTRSRGIHLITRPLTRTHALMIPVAGRHFFVIPWQGMSLIGTTDTPYAGSTDAIAVSHGDIADFLRSINTGLPAARLTPADVTHAYAGLRPLVSADGSTYTASRRSDIMASGDRLLSVIGGKWTTSRAVAEQCVNRVIQLGGFTARASDTATVPLPWRRAPVPATPAEDATAIRTAHLNEQAVTLADVLFRRTHFAILHNATDRRGQLERWGAVSAATLGWTEHECRTQVDAVIAQLRLVSMWPE